MKGDASFRASALVGLVTASLLTACATYVAKPLNGADVDAVLRSPDRSALARSAAELDHPRLSPIPVDFSRPLTPEAIAVLAVVANPDLRSLRSQQKVADAQVFAAGLLPDPQITLGVDRVLSPRDQGLSSAPAAGLALDGLAALATRSADRRAALARAAQVRLDIAWAEWNVAGQARLLAIRLPRLREAARWAGTAAAAADAVLDHSLAAALRGDLAGDDLEARRIAAEDADALARNTARDATTAAMELNRLLGLTPTEKLLIADATPLSPWQSPDSEALFEEARRSRLDLAALAAGYDSQQATVQRAVLGQYPRLSITLNRARDTSQVNTFGPAVTFDLPIWNRNRGEIRTAEADRDQLRDEYAARLHQARAEIAALVAALNEDEQLRAQLAAQIPSLERHADRVEAAARRGDVAWTAATSARAAVIDKRLAWLALDQSCAEQRLALMLAVGRPLPEKIPVP